MLYLYTRLIVMLILNEFRNKVIHSRYINLQMLGKGIYFLWYKRDWKLLSILCFCTEYLILTSPSRPITTSTMMSSNIKSNVTLLMAPTKSFKLSSL
jgi:hypothetical protein